MGALGDSYVTLEDVKGYLKIPLTSTSLDEALTEAIASASQEVERTCNRQFNKADAATPRVYVGGWTQRRQPLYFGIAWHGHLQVDDFYDSTGVIVELSDDGGATWRTLDSSEYEFHPLNGIVDGQPGWPYSSIEFFQPTYFVWHARRRVRVTAKWGWASVPAPVSQACRIMAAETFMMKDAPFGVAGMDQFGVVRVRDNRIAISKLMRYTRNLIQVG